MKAVLFLLITIPGIAHAPETSPWEIWNEFAETANEWARLSNRRQPGIINAAEMRLWNQMKRQWPEVRKAIDSTY